MADSNSLRFASIRTAGIQVTLHDQVRNAYGGWSALTRLLAVGDMPLEALTAMFAVRPMIAVQDGFGLRVVGGFSAFRIWCQLDAIRHRPARANFLLIGDNTAAIASIIDAELLLCVSDCTDRNVGPALLDFVEYLSPSLKAQVIGSGRVTKGRVAKLAGQDRRGLQRTKALSSSDDSDILNQLLAKL
jgi:hypothetical protein